MQISLIASTIKPVMNNSKPDEDRTLYNTTVDQMAAQKSEIPPEYNSKTKNDQTVKELAEEDEEAIHGKKEPSLEAKSSEQSASQSEENDYFNGMSQ